MVDVDPAESNIPFLTIEECRRLRNAFLNYEGFECDEAPSEEFRFVSLFSVGFDAAFTPQEVAKASPDWFNTSTERLTVPSRARSFPALRDTTWRFVERWLEERATLDRYDDTDAMWLTDDGTRYGGELLDDHFVRLCEEADIDLTDRPQTWKILRNTTGVHMAAEKGLRAVANQLGQKNRTDVSEYHRFVNRDHEQIREALQRMG